MAGAAKRMQQRRGTSSEWASLDPVLLAGEFGVETDTGVVKVGDGVKAWSGLEEIGGGGGTEAYVFEGPRDMEQPLAETVYSSVYMFESSGV